MGLPVVGTAATVDALTVDALKAFSEKTLTGPRVVVAGAGAVHQVCRIRLMLFFCPKPFAWQLFFFFHFFVKRVDNDDVKQGWKPGREGMKRNSACMCFFFLISPARPPYHVII